MQITQILISLVIISIVQATWVTRIPKPRLHSLLSWKLEILEIQKHKLPKARHPFSLFPKSYMKYVISPEAFYKIATHKLIVNETKKPLMTKLSQLEKDSRVVENEAKLVYDNNSSVTPTVNPVVISKEVSLESVEENSVESSETHADISEEKDKQQNNSNETKIAKTDVDEKEFPNLQDLTSIIPLTAKPFKVTIEKSEDSFSNVSYTTKNSKEKESSDSVDFIFVDSTQTPTESKKVISDKPEEYVAIEFYEEPKIERRKRGSNIIEEENLAPTVAGYKYTWKDTRLSNDVAFKNINS